MFRQDTVSRINHPEHLTINGIELTLIDDPLVDKIQTGDSVLGWEGDSRLAVYFNQKFLTWELWRFEASGEYALQEAWHARMIPAADIAGKMVDWLIRHDSHRGFNLYDHVSAENAKLEAMFAKEQSVFHEQVADGLAWAASKDGMI
jgi:hypothetical protein